MRALNVLALICAGALAAGCAAEADAGGDVRDLRVTPPAETEGWRNIVGGEATIAPGEEKMFCFHMTWDEADITIGEVEMLQGKMGHHAVIVTSKEPKPDGTVEDCTDQTTMWKFNALLIPVPELPEGMGIALPKGQHMLLQSHYVNVGDRPIRIRDVVRVKTRDAAKITKWVSTLSASIFDLELAPGESKTESFDCGFDQDLELILAGPHMHELGTSYRIDLGPSVDKLAPLQEVDEWIEEYRDSPPTVLALKAPIAVPKGSVLRTSCSWKNTRDHKVGFPEEMCTTFGYLAGTKTLYDCRKEKGKVTW